jgi:formyl-CoA transferase
LQVSNGDEPLGDSLLSGIRILDFTQALSGPFCTMLLADLGADVVKVEMPGRGDDARHWGPPFIGKDSAYFLSVNRNKSSIVIDLKTKEGRGSAQRLAAESDVVIVNWRDGIASRLGLSYETLKPLNEGLIYCAISAFGPGDNGRAGYDQIVQGTSGVMTLTGAPGEPTKWGLPVGDLAAGMFASTSILAALIARQHDGRGHRVDIAMEDSLIAMLTHYAAKFFATGVTPKSDYNSHGSIVPYGLYPSRDGVVNICVGNDAQFSRMCKALSLEILSSDIRFATNSGRTVHRVSLDSALTERTQQLSTDEIVDMLTGAMVPVGAVRDLGQVLTDPLVRSRGMILGLHREDFETFEVLNSPFRIDGVLPSVRRPPPTLGQDTPELKRDGFHGA